MEAVTRALGGADVLDGGAVDDALGHLVHERLGVLEAHQAAELFGVDPVAKGALLVGKNQSGEVPLHRIKTVEDLVHSPKG